ncbi:MAG: hypothetical protein P1V97_16890 [Planctomycetota bacterium]|nr:hypothetical protein [Planctomycetota bacterium]
MIRKLIPIILFLSLPALTAPVYGQEKEHKNKITVTAGKIDVDVKGMKFRDFCDELGRQLKLNVLVDPAVKARLTLKLGPLEQDQAFQVFATLIHGRVKEVSPKVYLFTQAPKNSFNLKKTTVHKALIRLTRSSKINLIIGPNLKDQPISSVKAKNFYPDDLIVTVAQQLGAVTIEQDGKFLRVVANSPLHIVGAKAKLAQAFMPADPKPLAASKSKKINVDVIDLELSKVMDQISRAAGVKIVVNSQVKEKVSVNLRDVSPWDALRVIAALARCRVEVRDRQYYIAPQLALTLSDHKTTIPKLIAKISKKLRRTINFPKELKGQITVQFTKLPAMDGLHFLVHSLGGYKIIDELGKPLKIVPHAKKR